MTFARAGHTPLIYLRGDVGGAPARRCSTPSGIVVGLRIHGATEKFAELLEEERLDLHKGDVLVLYTDGITEAMNAEQRSVRRRAAQPARSRSTATSTPADLRERILREIEAFVGGADQHDDMTMILLKIEEPIVMAAEGGGMTRWRRMSGELIVIFRTPSRDRGQRHPRPARDARHPTAPCSATTRGPRFRSR